MKTLNELWADKNKEEIRKRSVMKLRNGADVMFIAPKGPRDTERVVMCYYGTCLHPWVTWMIGEHGDAFWGHYFHSPIDALTDFRKRIKED